MSQLSSLTVVSNLFVVTGVFAINYYYLFYILGGISIPYQSAAIFFFLFFLSFSFYSSIYLRARLFFFFDISPHWRLQMGFSLFFLQFCTIFFSLIGTFVTFDFNYIRSQTEIEDFVLRHETCSIVFFTLVSNSE